MKHKRLLLLAASAFSFQLSVFSATYFVDSAKGSDDFPGTAETQPWRTLEKVNTADLQPGDTVRFARGGLWRGKLKPKSGAPDAPITYTAYGDDKLPKPRFYGSKPLNNSADWVRAGPGLWRTNEAVTDPVKNGQVPTIADVGNLIFDGKRAAIKRWSKEQLTADGHFWFEPETRRVWLVSERNPAETFREIEAALRALYVVSLTKVNHVVFSNLDVRYAGAHAFGGGNNSFITIRDCDISWIGGGHQFTRPDGVQVRFGNGVEFWGNAHDNLIEGCRIWEVYDAALTNQGQGRKQQRQQNITYRNNLIWNCEYSYEYWHGGEATIVDNISVVNNVCLNAGYGWGHSQRPDPNGRHLMFYETKAKTTNIRITNNIFAYAADSIWRIDSRRGQERTAEDSDTSQATGEEGVAWAKTINMDHNIWFQQPGRPLVIWQTEVITDFDTYRAKTGLDKNSLCQP